MPVTCRYVLKPVKRSLDRILQASGNGDGDGDGIGNKTITTWIRSREACFVVQTSLLILLIVAADYAGASILLAAYLAGVVVSWWDGEHSGPSPRPQNQSADDPATAGRRENQIDSQVVQVEPEFGSSSDDSDQRERDGDNSSPHATTTTTSPAATSTHTTTATEIFDQLYEQLVHRILKPFFFVCSHSQPNNT